MMSLSDDQQAYIIQGFNTTSRYLDDILSIHNTLFDDKLIQMYSSELQLVKLIPLIPKLCFWTCIFPVLMILFLPKFTINMAVLIMKLLVSHFLMAMLLTLHHMGFIFVNLSDVLEHLVMLQTSTLVKNI